MKDSHADWKPVDKQITMGEWLTCAVDQVPKLIRQSQVPSAFDFAKKDEFVIQR